MKRLNCLKAKINREPELFGKIEMQIKNLLEKGYASELSSAELLEQPERVWYLPIFITHNPNKPQKAKSLNDFMYTGPDLLHPLTEVLMAFRVGKIAVCGDIAEMFHQVRILESDAHAQRFVWYNNETQAIRTFVMRSMAFGISCAPCIAHYVRDKNAEEYKLQSPRAFEAITKAHYVDDYIDSLGDETEAIEVTLNIRNWASNSPEVLKHLQGVSLDLQSPKELGDPEKVLGMFWEPATDMFKYVFRFARMKRNVLSEEALPTKREVLQVLMSIFNPLRLSCYTIGLKMLLQEIWRTGIGWDDILPGPQLIFWTKWKDLLPQATTIQVPRHYSPLLCMADFFELHTFVEASEYGYAAVCYFRIGKEDDITVSLIAAKSKVAHLKPLS